MNRTQRKELVAKLDTLIAMSFKQLNDLGQDIQFCTSQAERIQIAKLKSKVLMDLRRLLRFRAELLDPRLRQLGKLPPALQEAVGAER